MTSFPWKEAMRFGLGVLRLPPEAFWKMSPRELRRPGVRWWGSGRGRWIGRGLRV